MDISLNSAARPAAPDETKATEALLNGPLAAAAGLRGTLSDGASADAGARPLVSGRRAAPLAPTVHEERRHHERRRLNLPVLLDTRVGERRQNAAGETAINCAI